MSNELKLSPEMLEALRKRCACCGKNYGSHAPDTKFPGLLLCPEQSSAYILGIPSMVNVWKEDK